MDNNISYIMTIGFFKRNEPKTYKYFKLNFLNKNVVRFITLL